MTKDEWQALQWCRTSHTGRRIREHLLEKIAAARVVYEDKPASEQQRLLLVAYKELYAILFDQDIKEII